ncbi:MAG: hypothetical protein ACRD2E_03740 [Terriglobales bacterium]
MMDRTHFSRLAALLLLTALAAAAAPPPAGVYVRRRGDTWALGNAYLERDIAVTGGVVGTTAIVNRLDHRAYSLAGGEFQLQLIRERVGYAFGGQNPWVLTARDFMAGPPRITVLPGGGRRLSFPLRLRHSPGGDQPGLAVTLSYALRPGDFYTRQWLRLEISGTGTFFMDRVAPFRDRVGVARFRLGGFGQPLFTRDLFFGLEYPTSLNTAQPAGALAPQVTLGRVVGEDIPAAGYRTQAAVVGVAPLGAVHRQFMRYVARLRVAPVRPYLLYNTWFDMPGKRQNLALLLTRVAQFHRRLGQYHLRLNSFVLDDSWDSRNRLWRVSQRRFPGGFAPLVQALAAQLDTHLGLWFGPIGGYGHRDWRLAAGRKLGMEITTNGQYLCLAGRNYSRYFTATLLRDQRRYDVNYFKLDGVPFGCNNPDHGHPVGIYSREADARVFIHLLQALRAQNPRVFINATTSIWLSPWWLQYADTVWMGGEDSGYLPTVPTLQPRQSAISYRDSVLYEDFVTHQLQFPLNSIMTHGIIRGTYNLLGGAHEPLRQWDDAIMHYFSVGNMMYELYITPSILGNRAWAALAAGIHWAQANAHPLLDNTTMVLGDPARRQVYGFVHSSAAKTFVTLRNPFVRPRAAVLPLSAQNGFAPLRAAGPMTGDVIYPYRQALGSIAFGQDLRVDLGAYQEKVIELRPAAASRLTVLGTRYAVAGCAVGASDCHLTLYAPAGADPTVTVQAPGAAARSRRLHFGPAGASVDEPIFSAPQLVEDGADAAQLRLRVTIPPDFRRARLAVLWQPPQAAPGIAAAARDNGQAAATRVVTGAGGQAGQWVWFQLPLAPGTHRLAMEFDRSAGMPHGARISVWLLANRQLAQRTLPLPLAPGVPLPSGDAPPTRPSQQAETYALLARTLH